MTKEQLQSQLDVTLKELDEAKAHVHRCEGAIAMIKHFISLLENENADANQSE